MSKRSLRRRHLLGELLPGTVRDSVEPVFGYRYVICHVLRDKTFYPNFGQTSSQRKPKGLSKGHWPACDCHLYFCKFDHCDCKYNQDRSDEQPVHHATLFFRIHEMATGKSPRQGGSPNGRRHVHYTCLQCDNPDKADKGVHGTSPCNKLLLGRYQCRRSEKL
jgi:hypothetical protein